MPKNGYVYIYCSNESPVDMFFDNLQVVHTRGPILEETHYYPFGLQIPGISSKANKGSDYSEDKKKYNGIEFNKDFDLNTYEAYYRTLDPAIARWWQIDPKMDEGYESVSPYASMYDDPVLYSDPLGDEGEESTSGCCEVLREAIISAGSTLNGMLNTVTFGIWPTSKYSNEHDQQISDNATRIGQFGGMFIPTPHSGPKVEIPHLDGQNLTIKVPALTLPKPVQVAIPKAAIGTAPAPVKTNAEHTKGARNSTKGKHESGQARKAQDRGGSKGMSNPPRKRPDGWKGPWPPKTPPPAQPPSQPEPPPVTPPPTNPPPTTPPPAQNTTTGQGQ